MAALIYSLCALTCVTCAVLLMRSYAATRLPLLLWSGLCFVLLTVSNIILVLDRLVYADVDLTTFRLGAALIGLLLLLAGLIWENE
jgi:hypothetical protein